MMSDQRVEFFFILPLARPQAPAGNSLRWQIYDDTYFIEFLYDDKTESPLTLVDAPKGCSTSVQHADPDPKKVAAASAIDMTGNAPAGLGRYFADTGVLECRVP